MISFENPLWPVLLAFATAFAFTYIAIPSIINIAKVKHLYDEPGARKAHLSRIPTLGGVAIFGGFIISVAIWSASINSSQSDLRIILYTLAAACVIFLVGAKDDIVDLDAHKKFMGQIIATFLIVVMANLRFTSFYDLFGGGSVPDWLSIIITAFTILVIINSFNLIDGINGLSGTLGGIIACAFGIWFWKNGDYTMVVLCAALAGSLIAFLRYNVSPATIFMGDTGSLLLGLLCAVMALRFVETGSDIQGEYFTKSLPGITIGFLAIPLFDLLRAFSIRIFKRKSPFSPDRNHMHHMLIDSGCSHMKATYILATAQIGFILLALLLKDLGSWPLIGILLALSVIFAAVLDSLRKNGRNKQSTEVEHHSEPVA